MRLIDTAVYRGPHLYSDTPMIRMVVDLEALEDWPSDRLEGFNGKLTAALPGLANHGCCFHEPGGFLRRLEEGTWMGHIVEHVALELQTLAGHRVTRGKTRSIKGHAGCYNVLYAYEDVDVGVAAGRMALRLVDSLLPQGLSGLKGVEGAAHPFDLAACLAELSRQVRAVGLGPSTAALVAEARRRDIPVQRLNQHSLIRLGWGARQKLIRASVTGNTSLIAAEAAGDKDLAKALMIQAGIPAPRGVLVRTAEQAVEAAKGLNAPLVTKPLDGNHGRGVSLDLTTPEAVAWGFEQAIRHSRRVIVEEQLKGRDYRILVVDGRVVAVAERQPAQVTGDGQSSIAALIEGVNADSRRGEGHEKVMTRIAVDDHVLERLSRQGLTLESIPQAGETVILRATANLSTGGEAIDRTAEIHPDNASVAARAARLIGLDVAGVDFIAPDIARSVHETGGGVVEINAAPGLRMHLEPSRGTGRDVAGPIIASLMPQPGDGRIPIAAITGTNGKSTTVRMVTKILARHGRKVGFTTTSGVYVGAERIFKGDASGPKSARMVLADRTVEAAVLETARGGILREGLGFDRCDVGCVLNIAEDHLGLKGIDTIEGLAAVKEVVVESVSRDGLSVLNADDPMTLRMARHARGRIAWFSMRGGEAMSPQLQKHIAEGGLAAVLEPSVGGGELVLVDRAGRWPVTSVEAIPATLGGKAAFNIANALAACLIGRGLGVPIDTIAAALADFRSSFEDNPGRMNVHEAHGFKVIVDYAHNPAGLRALGEVIAELRPSHRSVIGTASIPGDRRDDDIRQMGALAAELFDYVVFRERPDGRGRPPGEVLSLLYEGAISTGKPKARIECIEAERPAILACLARARPGDLVVLLPTKVEDCWRLVTEFRPQGGKVRAERSAHA